MRSLLQTARVQALVYEAISWLNQEPEAKQIQSPTKLLLQFCHEVQAVKLLDSSFILGRFQVTRLMSSTLTYD